MRTLIILCLFIYCFIFSQAGGVGYYAGSRKSEITFLHALMVLALAQ